MDTPEKPPNVIPPLTSCFENGEPYRRHKTVEAELLSVLPRAPAEWIKAMHRLKSESLVFLLRYSRHQDDDVAGRLQEALNVRTMRTGRRWIYGIYKEGTEFILSEVEAEIAALTLAEVPSRQSEYLEMAFGQAVYRHAKNAVERFLNTPFAHQANVEHEVYGESGGG